MNVEYPVASSADKYVFCSPFVCTVYVLSLYGVGIVGAANSSGQRSNKRHIPALDLVFAALVEFYVTT